MDRSDTLQIVPAIQPDHEPMSWTFSGVTWSSRIMSAMNRRPPARRTRKTSREDSGLVQAKVENAVGDHRVDRIAWHGKRFHVGLMELDVCQVEGFSISLGLGDHLCGRVDADHPAGRTDLAGGEDAVHARPAPEVQHGLARIDLAERKRIAHAGKGFGDRVGQSGQSRRQDIRAT